MGSASFAATIATVLSFGLVSAQSCGWTYSAASPSTCSSSAIGQCLLGGGSTTVSGDSATLVVHCPFGDQTLGVAAAGNTLSCTSCIPNPGSPASDLAVSVDTGSGALTATITAHDGSGACTYTGAVTSGSCGGYAAGGSSAPSAGSSSSSSSTDATPTPATHRGYVQVTLDLTGISEAALNNNNMQQALAAAAQKLVGLTNGQVSVSIVNVAPGPAVTVQIATGPNFSLDNLVTLVKAGINELAANSAAAQQFEAELASAAGVSTVTATATDYVVVDSTSSDASTAGAGALAIVAASLVTAVVVASL